MTSALVSLMGKAAWWTPFKKKAERQGELVS
jgi:hypothetical protein